VNNKAFHLCGEDTKLETWDSFTSLIVGIGALFGAIATLISGTRDLFKEVRSVRKESKKLRISKVIYSSGAIIVGLILMGAVIVYASKWKKAERFIELRNDLEGYQQRLYHDVLYQFSKMLSDSTAWGSPTVIGFSRNVSSLYGEIESKFADEDLTLGLQIYRYDLLSYYAVVSASLEDKNDGASAINWADKSIGAAHKAVGLIQIVKDENRKHANNSSYSKLISWIERDNVENRLHYLLGWALAIKVFNSDIQTRISQVEEQIAQIAPIYHRLYPIKDNPDFGRMKEKFSESFRAMYFSVSDFNDWTKRP